jgi:hypothetical protein
MDEELVSILSRNTASIVIGYLTDPPPLPFIHLLEHVMSRVKYTCDHAIFYNDYLYSRISHKIIDNTKGIISLISLKSKIAYDVRILFY